MAMTQQEVEDQMELISHYYPGVYTQLMPESGDQAKPRRRRKKSKGGEGGDGAARKRKLTEEQVTLLEQNFGNEHKLESERKDKLASELGLDPRQVAVWFQNRRARWKNKKLEEEYSKLKAEHDSNVLDKCRLQSEVLKLKEQLLEAEMEIQRLSERERSDGGSNSESPSFSMDPPPPFLGEFGMEGLENVGFLPENNYTYAMEWVNLYGM